MVFGLHEQRERLADGVTPVAVEGTFDVMALAASPVGEQVVPVTTSGTAVTTQHLQADERATDSRGRLVIASTATRPDKPPRPGLPNAP